MKLAKWGNSLAVRIPKDVAEELGFAEGDDLRMEVGAGDTILLSKAEDRARVIARIMKVAKPLPPGWKLDRDEAAGW